MAAVGVTHVHAVQHQDAEVGLVLRAEPKRWIEVTPLYVELRGLVLNAVGLVDVLRDALTDDGIQVAFVFGSVARGQEGAYSDVDLMVIGKVGLRALSVRLRGVTERIGREVNPTVLNAPELRARVARGDPFVSRVLSEPALFVIGTRDELGELAS